MVFCTECGSQISPGGKFCQECGNKSTERSQSLEFYQGTMRSLNNSEEWKYDKGDVHCIQGNPNKVKFTWDGHNLKGEKGLGFFNEIDNILTWTFPQHPGPYYTYSWKKTEGIFHDDKGIQRVEPTTYIAYVHWKLEDREMTAMEGSDKKEGQTDRWEVLGEVPPPVCLFIAMYSRALKLLEEAIEKSSRRFKRCGKIVLSSTAPTLICKQCNKDDNLDFCIACNAECSSSKFDGQLCKTCTPRKNFCVKCSDPLAGSTKKGYLCSNCGLGSKASNCCKMIAQSS